MEWRQTHGAHKRDRDRWIQWRHDPEVTSHVRTNTHPKTRAVTFVSVLPNADVTGWEHQTPTFPALVLFQVQTGQMNQSPHHHWPHQHRKEMVVKQMVLLYYRRQTSLSYSQQQMALSCSQMLTCRQTLTIAKGPAIRSVRAGLSTSARV